MNSTGTLNLAWANSLINGLAAAGMRHLVISPGSRSTPIVLAGDRHPQITTHVQIDERCAAFFALGLARHRGQPVAVVATSGSAPTHWYPAVVEANHARIPLILLSADRPPGLHARGANQTIDQNRLFGSHVRAFHDPGIAREGENALTAIQALAIQAAQEACQPEPGPVHINLPFNEPLLPDSAPPPTPSIAEPPSQPEPRQPSSTQIRKIAQQINSQPGLILCGPDQFADDFPEQVTALAKALNTPILADPLSNLRFGSHDRSQIFCRYDAFLRNREIDRPAWVIQFGRPPISKALQQFLTAQQSLLIPVTPYEEWPDPLYLSSEVIRSDPGAFCSALQRESVQAGAEHWIALFRELEQSADIRWPTEDEEPPFEGIIIRQLIDCLPDGCTLFSGNSQPIRQLDSWTGGAEKPLRIVANRGVSGIDGNISTLLGLAAASTRPVIGLIGDLALYHDMNGLLAAKELNATLIVFNNGGGAIFGHLPQSNLEQFEKYWLTPCNIEISKIADLYNLPFSQVTKSTQFKPALKRALIEKGVSLIEVVIDRKRSLAHHQAYWKEIKRYSANRLFSRE